MPPDTGPPGPLGPQIRPALEMQQVILYRLDALDRNVARLVTLEQLHVVERRIDHLERDDEERERWMKQLTVSVIAAVVTGLISLMIALYIH